jgi:hypothetical protein
MDYNRWHGHRADVLAFIGEGPQEALICPVDGCPCPRLFADDVQEQGL